MCGFTGFLRFSGLPGAAAERSNILGDMVTRLAHRGPDDEQRYDDGILALGFRRLSVIDVEGGQQPIWNEDKRILGVVNGEIYNHLELRAQLEGTHSFRSHSDSEVVIHLYEDHGLDMLRDVNGMYGLAIWDVPRKRLLLARDRLGIKPLYYAVAGDTVIFGSELKALLAHPDCPRALNWQDVEPKTTGRLPVTPSYISGVNHLPAGHMIIFEPGKIPDPAAYWSLNDHFADQNEEPKHSPQYYIERYGELFDDCVRRQLMSDVPLGIFLSGGIDSSLITAVAAAQETGLHCFTVAEETTVMSGDLEQARRVAEKLGCPLHAVRFNKETLLDELQFDLPYLEYMVWCMDSPRFQFEWLFKHELHRYVKTHIPDIKVILLGQGADEFAGGYSNNSAHDRKNWDHYLTSMVQPAWEIFRQLEDDAIVQLPPGSSIEPARSMRSDYQHLMHMVLCTLQFHNLWHEDRTSSSHGIESRVPFLDHRLVEFLASIPPAFHKELFWDKHIVRAQLKRLLPGYPVDWPKVPFIDVPDNTSINYLHTEVLKRTFADFQDKYVAFSGSNSYGQQADQLYEKAVSGSPEANAATRQLLYIMCVAIFEKLCLEGDRCRPLPSIPASSPLQEVTEDGAGIN